MADWFKFYCDGLDEPRFRYALRALPEVCPVWLLILSECCRTKSDTLEWSGDEVDLIGWSEKTCASPGKVNEAINLLVKIRYLEPTKTTITVRKWNDLQSDYCRKFAKKKVEVVRQSPTKSDKVPLEESRVEEIRIEKKKEQPPASRADHLEVPDKLKTQEFMAEWARWQTYRREMKGVKNWVELFKYQIEHLSTFDVKTATEMLKQSLRNGWKGIFELKSTGSQGYRGNPTENSRNAHTCKPVTDYAEAAKLRQRVQAAERAARNGEVQMVGQMAQDGSPPSPTP